MLSNGTEGSRVTRNNDWIILDIKLDDFKRFGVREICSNKEKIKPRGHSVKCSALIFAYILRDA